MEEKRIAKMFRGEERREGKNKLEDSLNTKKTERIQNSQQMNRSELATMNTSQLIIVCVVFICV